MAYVKDFKWKKGIKVSEYVDSLANIGFQSIQLANAAEVFVKMKRNSAKIFLDGASSHSPAEASFANNVTNH